MHRGGEIGRGTRPVLEEVALERQDLGGGGQNLVERVASLRITRETAPVAMNFAVGTSEEIAESGRRVVSNGRHCDKRTIGLCSVTTAKKAC